MPNPRVLLADDGERRVLLLGNEAIARGARREYPKVEEILREIRNFANNITLVDAEAIAEKAGATITQKAVMLGGLVATEKLPMRVDTFKCALRDLLPPKYVDMKLRAFKLGYTRIKRTFAHRVT